MKVVILCDSIIGNHCFKSNEEASKFLQCEISLMKTNTLSSFEEVFVEIPACDLVVVATVLNQVSFLENKWSGSFDSGKIEECISLVSEMCGIVNNYVANHLSTNVWVMPAITRTSPDWIEQVFARINEVFENDLEGDLVAVLEPPPITKDDLSVDGVHLIAHGNNKLKNYLKKVIDTFREKRKSNEDVEMTKTNSETNGRKRQRREPEEDDSGPSTSKALTIDEKLDLLINKNSDFLAKCSKLEDDVSEVRKKTEEIEKKINSQLVAEARDAEEKDEARNYNRRNCLIVRNLPFPSGITHYQNDSDMFTGASNTIKEELSKLQVIDRDEIKVVSINLLPINVDQGMFKPIRINCETAGDAVEIRKRILAAKNQNTCIWSDVDVQNDPVKATRVRLFLMNCMAKALRSEDYNVAIVRYADIPTMIVKKDRFSSGHLNFVDSIMKYGDKLTSNDISKARNICGRDFKGRMERMFLVIKEVSLEVSIPTPTVVESESTPSVNRSFRGRGRFTSSWRGRGRGRGRGYQSNGFTTRSNGSQINNLSFQSQSQLGNQINNQTFQPQTTFSIPSGLMSQQQQQQPSMIQTFPQTNVPNYSQVLQQNQFQQ